MQFLLRYSVISSVNYLIIQFSVKSVCGGKNNAKIVLSKVGGVLLSAKVRNEAVVVGSTAAFTCTTNTTLPMRWHRRAYNKSDGVFTRVYNGIKLSDIYKQRYSVSFNTSTGVSMLSINDVQPTDAGTFRCLEFDTAAHAVDLELDVLGKYSHRYVLASCYTLKADSFAH